MDCSGWVRCESCGCRPDVMMWLCKVMICWALTDSSIYRDLVNYHRGFESMHCVHVAACTRGCLNHLVHGCHRDKWSSWSRLLFTQYSTSFTWEQSDMTLEPDAVIDCSVTNPCSLLRGCGPSFRLPDVCNLCVWTAHISILIVRSNLIFFFFFSKPCGVVVLSALSSRMHKALGWIHI